MKQKYIIKRIAESGELTIQEYAVVNSDSYRKTGATLSDQDFELLSQQSYDIPGVEKALTEGKDSLIGFLRTDQFFPISGFIEKIGTAVVELFEQEERQSVVLMFDDMDEFLPPEEEENAEDLIDEKTSVAAES
jgi:hypothetical protein